MKLIFCKKCADVVALRKQWRTCICQASGGKYIDDLNAEIAGEAIPLGFANPSFLNALRHQPELPPGFKFEAFVIEKQCRTIRRAE